MEELLFLAQRTSQSAPSAAFEGGAKAGAIIGGVIMLTMLVGSLWAIVKFPAETAERIALAVPMLCLPFTGVIVVGVCRMMEIPPPGSLFLIILAGWVLWLIMFLYARSQINRYANESEWAEAERRAKARKGPPGPASASRANAGGADGGLVPQQAVEPPAAAPNATARESQPKITPDTPVVARCKACMGRWKTTAGEAKALESCPKCGASPPDLRLQRA